jgi:protein-disulfide isomerase
MTGPRVAVGAWLAAASLLTCVPSVSAQSADELRALRHELEGIKAGQEQLQKDVQEIKTILRGARPAGPPTAPPIPPPGAGFPPNLTFSLDGEPAKGDRSAKVVVVEFTDYQCPFCGRHVREALPQIEAEYIKTGKIRYVTREFPLEQLHPQAFKASEAALCAGDQGKYWEMHDRLFANQRALGPDQLAEHAQAIGANGPAFARCLEAGKKADKIRKDLAEGAKAGVSGTPAFFIGLADGANVKVVRTIKGALPFSAFKEALDSALVGPK